MKNRSIDTCKQTTSLYLLVLKLPIILLAASACAVQAFESDDNNSYDHDDTPENTISSDESLFAFSFNAQRAEYHSENSKDIGVDIFYKVEKLRFASDYTGTVYSGESNFSSAAQISTSIAYQLNHQTNFGISLSFKRSQLNAFNSSAEVDVLNESSVQLHYHYTYENSHLGISYMKIDSDPIPLSSEATQPLDTQQFDQALERLLIRFPNLSKEQIKARLTQKIDQNTKYNEEILSQIDLLSLSYAYDLNEHWSYSITGSFLDAEGSFSTSLYFSPSWFDYRSHWYLSKGKDHYASWTQLGFSLNIYHH